ncbi:MAG: ATP synthase gamma chain [Ignavibacteria bacterium]|nr:ATP synthase gamma chain [Ignavibacteria bacterium]
MATLKELKVRISGIKSTQKITKAMKMVSSAKMKRAQDKIIAARPFAYKINKMLNELILNAETGSIDDLLNVREVKTKCVVIVSSDKGLAGSFNTNIIRYSSNYLAKLDPETKIITVGKKATDFFKKKKVRLINSYPGVFNDLTIDISNEIVNYIVESYKKKEFDSVEIIYNEFKSVVKQLTVKEQFLPLTGEEVKDGKNKSTDLKNENTDEKKKAVKTDYIYEPSLIEIIKELIPKQLKVQFWKILLESNAAEQAARLTAMETATKNAQDLLKILEVSYNQARQAAITKEILEIVGGAEALKES